LSEIRCKAPGKQVTLVGIPTERPVGGRVLKERG
jgi:hypothetical protein